MRAMILRQFGVLRQFDEVFHDAGFMTSAGVLFYRADRALD